MLTEHSAASAVLMLFQVSKLRLPRPLLVNEPKQKAQVRDG